MIWIGDSAPGELKPDLYITSLFHAPLEHHSDLWKALFHPEIGERSNDVIAPLRQASSWSQVRRGPNFDREINHPQP